MMKFFSIAAIVLTAHLVASQVPTGWPSCATICVNSTCPTQTLDCICTNVTAIGNCIGSNCSSADAAAAAPFIGFCYLSGTPTFASQTTSVSATSSGSSSTTPTVATGSVSSGAVSTGGSSTAGAVSSGSASTAAASSSAVSSSTVSSSGCVVIGNGPLAGVLGFTVAMAIGFIVF